MTSKLAIISILFFLSLASGHSHSKTPMLMQTGQYDFAEVDVDASSYTNREQELTSNEQSREADFAGSFVQSLLKSGMKMPHQSSTGHTTMQIGYK